MPASLKRKANAIHLVVLGLGFQLILTPAHFDLARVDLVLHLFHLPLGVEELVALERIPKRRSVTSSPKKFSKCTSCEHQGNYIHEVMKGNLPQSKSHP